MGHSKTEWSDFPKHEKKTCAQMPEEGEVMEHEYQDDILGSDGA